MLCYAAPAWLASPALCRSPHTPPTWRGGWCSRRSPSAARCAPRVRVPSDTLRATLGLLRLPRTGAAEVVGAPLGGEGPQDRARWQSSNPTLALVSRVQSNLSYALVESERVVSTPLVVKRSDSNHTGHIAPGALVAIERLGPASGTFCYRSEREPV